jgi:FkbM family methyltransferase
VPVSSVIPQGRRLQPLYRKLHTLSLLGMNYGGAARKDSERIVLSRLGDSPVVFDGGANVGDYVDKVLGTRPRAQVYAFEPAADSYKVLAARFPSGVHLHEAALSDNDGGATLYSDEPMSESASIFPQSRWHWTEPAEFEPRGSVRTCTVDRVCAENAIGRVDLLKLDVEGAEIVALGGARDMLAEHRIGLIQFEYGLSALSARVCLRDFFELLDGWTIHRLVSDGLVPISYDGRWEIACATNYVAIPG